MFICHFFKLNTPTRCRYKIYSKNHWKSAMLNSNYILHMKLYTIAYKITGKYQIYYVSLLKPLIN